MEVKDPNTHPEKKKKINSKNIIKPPQNNPSN